MSHVNTEDKEYAVNDRKYTTVYEIDFIVAQFRKLSKKLDNLNAIYEDLKKRSEDIFSIQLNDYDEKGDYSKPRPSSPTYFVNNSQSLYNRLSPSQKDFSGIRRSELLTLARDYYHAEIVALMGKSDKLFFVPPNGIGQEPYVFAPARPFQFKAHLQLARAEYMDAMYDLMAQLKKLRVEGYAKTSVDPHILQALSFSVEKVKRLSYQFQDALGTAGVDLAITKKEGDTYFGQPMFRKDI